MHVAAFLAKFIALSLDLKGWCQYISESACQASEQSVAPSLSRIVVRSSVMSGTAAACSISDLV